jgi:predicted RNase H-like nuclease (RuvC/YqgF family)
MCGKKSKRGLRVIALSLVFLVLALSPLAAWPFSFGETESTPTQTLQVPSTEDVEQRQQVALLKQQIEQLENQLSESQKMLDTLSNNLEKSGVKSNNTQATAESLLNEIESLKSFLKASEDSRKALETEYDTLLAEYNLKASEADGYYQEATAMTAKYNALKGKQKSITTTVGTAAVMKDGKYGIDVTAGVNFGKVGVFTGATYMFDEDSLMAPADLMYKAGFAFTF